MQQYICFRGVLAAPFWLLRSDDRYHPYQTRASPCCLHWHFILFYPVHRQSRPSYSLQSWWPSDTTSYENFSELQFLLQFLAKATDLLPFFCFLGNIGLPLPTLLESKVGCSQRLRRCCHRLVRDAQEIVLQYVCSAWNKQDIRGDPIFRATSWKNRGPTELRRLGEVRRIRYLKLRGVFSPPFRKLVSLWSRSEACLGLAQDSIL